MSDPFAPLAGSNAILSPQAGKAARVIVVPVPADAPAPPKHKLGDPTATWRYLDAAGDMLGYVRRFDAADGKQFRPQTLWRDAATGAMEWRWESWPAPRPLYGLDRLATQPTSAVVITEGEKACDAAQRLLPGLVAVTSPNGSKSAGKADWLPLAGRRIVIWPDADEAGLAFAMAVAKALGPVASSVAIVSPPPDCSVGWDAADAEAEKWSQGTAAAFIDGAKPLDQNTTGGEKAGGHRRRESRSDALMQTLVGLDLWHDADCASYASMPIWNHIENWPLRSASFKRWLANLSRIETGQVVSGQALDDVIRNLEAIAINERACHTAHLRVGGNAGRLFIDLCDDEWRAVEVTRDGWRIMERPPVKFIRTPAMRALPAPVAGDSGIDLLRTFLNVKGPDDFMLIAAFMVAALRERGPYPILVVNGEQGTGKSVFSRMIRSLVDPNAAPIRSAPKDDRDLIVSAMNSRVLAFDNMSAMPNWLSDSLCRITTGGGFATRMLHTDTDEVICEVQCPVILNGIPSLTDRADLADRALNVHLAVIPETHRRPEDEFFAEFEAQRPLIFGGLLDAVSTAMRHVGDIKLDRLPRMADFVKWVTAAESGLGWATGEFLKAYNRNRAEVSEGAFEADAVAVALRDFVLSSHPDGWEGTPTELLTALSQCVSESARKSRAWPATAQGLGNRLERVGPLLRGKGFVIERRHSEKRTITIIPPTEAVPL